MILSDTYELSDQNKCLKFLTLNELLNKRDKLFQENQGKGIWNYIDSLLKIQFKLNSSRKCQKRLEERVSNYNLQPVEYYLWKKLRRNYVGAHYKNFEKIFARLCLDL